MGCPDNRSVWITGSTLKSQAVKKGAALCKTASMKKATDGGQEMAVMVGQWQNF